MATTVDPYSPVQGSQLPAEPLRARIRGRQPVVGIFLSIASTVTAEKVARAGFDFVTVDLQHGEADYRDALRMITAVNAHGAIAFARPPVLEPGIIGRLLDAGARGIIVPMVGSAEDAIRAVHACRYEPLGSRSFGPMRSRMYVGPDTATANEDTTVIVQIETTQAVANVAEIASVPGVDAVFAGPGDLSVSLGLAPMAHGDPAFEGALDKIASAAAAASIGAAIPAEPDLLARRLSQGYTLLHGGNDLGEIEVGVARRVAAFREAVGASTNGARP